VSPSTKPIVAASDVGSRAMASTMVVAGPSNTSAAPTARIRDARLYVVATNPVGHPNQVATTIEREDGSVDGVEARIAHLPRC